MAMRSTRMSVITGLTLALVMALPVSGIHAQARRPVPVPESDPPTDSAADSRTADERKQDVNRAAAARDLPGLTAGMAQACRVEAWQFSLVSMGYHAVRLDVSPTLSGQDRDCLKNVVYASRYHFNRR